MVVCQFLADLFKSSSDIDNLTDDEIIQLRLKTRPLPESVSFLDWGSVFRITEGTVVKSAQGIEKDIEEASEALALDLVFSQTTIPVPRVRRVVQWKNSLMIAMDYIPGRQLSQVWPSLSFLSKLGIAITLRRYVRQLRRIRHPRSIVPGPLATHEPRNCESPIFGSIQSARGPFASYQELSEFFNDRLRRTLRAYPYHRADNLGNFDDSAPLVFTHQDLNMRNLIVGDDGQLWVIDWAWSGFYPRWFEFIAMRRQAGNEEIVTNKKEPLWDALIPFICDPYYKQARWVAVVQRALDWV